VVDLVKEWRARVRMLHTDHTVKGREEVKRCLELLKAGCTFCREAAGEEDELGGMDKEYRELVHEVRIQELEFKFPKLQEKFRYALTTRADREIMEAASGGGGVVCSSRPQTPCHKLWSYAEARKSAFFLSITKDLSELIFCAVTF
jgi:hypothetical protein